MRTKIATLLSLLLLVGIMAVFLTLFESVSEVQDVGWQRAAQQNPFLAAERFLVRQGLNVQSQNHFESSEELQKKASLLISNSRLLRSKTRLKSYVNWIEKGGHLIVAAGAHSDENSDLLLEYFSITAQTASFQEESEEKVSDEGATEKTLSEQFRELNKNIAQQRNKKPKSADSFEKGVSEEKQMTLTFEDVNTSLTIHFSTDRRLHHPDFDGQDISESFEGPRHFTAQGDSRGIHFLQINVGEGMLTVLSDADIWRSEQVGYFDHAYLLRLLVEETEVLHIVYGAEMPPLWRLAPQKAPELCFSGLILLLAWLLQQGRRFTSIRTRQTAIRRSISEHIFASAAYLWRGRWTQTLLTPLQADIHQQARHKHPAYATLEPEPRHRYLARQSGLSLITVQKAMNPPTLEKKRKSQEADFVQDVACLQKIRSAL